MPTSGESSSRAFFLISARSLLPDDVSCDEICGEGEGTSEGISSAGGSEGKTIGGVGVSEDVAGGGTEEPLKPPSVGADPVSAPSAGLV